MLFRFVYIEMSLLQLTEELFSLLGDAQDMEEEESIELIRRKEKGEKNKKRKERDDQGGKALMERAMKAARTEAPDTEDAEFGEPKVTIGSRRSSAAKQIAAARERSAELHLERSQSKMEVQREIELERIRSMERIEKMKADQALEIEKLRSESNTVLFQAIVSALKKE